MNIVQTTNREAPLQILENYFNDYYCLELLRFFGAHPFTRFSELAVIHALNENGGKHLIKNALSRLINDRIIIECVENDISLYKLTADESVRVRVVLWPRLVGRAATGT